MIKLQVTQNLIFLLIKNIVCERTILTSIIRPTTNVICKTKMGHNLLQVIAVAQTLINLSFVLASFPERKYDCSAIIQASTLDSYKNVCHYMTDWKDEALELSTTNKLDLVETCTCNLLQHTLAWESMVTQEVEALFHVARQMVRDNNDEDNIKKNSILLENDQDGHMYFWDRFNSILRKTDLQNGDTELCSEILERFAKSYYNPDLYHMPFVKTSVSRNLRRVVTITCEQLIDEFGDFLKILNNLKKLSGNSRYIYRIVSYDKNLYMIVTVVKICQLLSISGELLDS